MRTDRQTDRQTDRWTEGRIDMTQLIVALRNFGNAPNYLVLSRRFLGLFFLSEFIPLSK
jgi:hypothetical protein